MSESTTPNGRTARLADVCFGADGLVPTVAVDAATGRVLMLAYMDQDALETSLRTGQATYFSRARRRPWVKGETSGNRQDVRRVWLDCDGDALVVEVDQHGSGACHLGAWSCFHRELAAASAPAPSGADEAGPGAAQASPAEGEAWPADASVLDALRSLIRERRLHPAEGSYTASLLARGIDAPLKKLAEEAGEVILAAKDVDRLRPAPGEAGPTMNVPAVPAGAGDALGRAYDALAWEAADLLYHLMVVLEAAGLPPEAVWRELVRRHQGGRSR